MVSERDEAFADAALAGLVVCPACDGEGGRTTRPEQWDEGRWREHGSGIRLRCPLCGARFTHGLQACPSCPINAGCTLVTCPRCEYSFPRTSRLVSWLRRLFGRTS